MERLLLENEEAMEIRTEEAKRSGLYAKETIDQILTGFKQSIVVGDDDTFLEMTDLLEIFYNDTEMNRELTMVRGNDFCEILALFFDLSEAIRNNYIQQLKNQDTLQAEYDKLVAKQAKPKTKKVKAKKKASKKGKLDMSITESYISIEDNPKYLNLADVN